MSSISIETKKLTDLRTITVPGNDNLIPIHDGTDLKTITYQNLAESVVAPVEEKIAPLLFDGAGAHNAIYRGKHLGTAVTDEQYAAISSGTFKDLYIGDYWYIDGVNWRIAAFDYYWNCGDTPTKSHHAVIVPDRSLDENIMNASDTTEGGYVGSMMHTSILDDVKTRIKSIFIGHVLSHRICLVNAVSQGRPSGSIWVNSEVDLMNEQMVYGTGIFSPVSTGTSLPSNFRVEKNQLPLFRYNPAALNIAEKWWLRDVVSDTNFAAISFYGTADENSAFTQWGIRPSFCIY